MDRIALVLNQVSSIQDAPDAIAKPILNRKSSLIKFLLLSTGKYVIRDLSLTITKGQKIAFVGASGGGKTRLQT
jgi:ABC-type bacteriocin/lantibiotic exporter with double-glycine peptidase domain